MKTNDAFRLSLQKIQRQESAVELVYVSHERWPCPPLSIHQHQLQDIRISIVDSSFNPPTHAHLVLANSLPPRCTMKSSLSGPSQASATELDYHARLLLLSVRNADKALRPSDATYEQRLEMMCLLAKDVSRSFSQLPGDRPENAYANVAIAIIDEPAFVGKATVLQQFLRAHIAALYPSLTTLDNGATTLTSDEMPILSPRLVFLIGFDTLVRLLSSRYYASEAAMMDALRLFFSPVGDDCYVVCARRTLSGVQHAVQEEVEAKTLSAAKEFVESERLTLIDLGVGEISSSQVRTKVAMKDEIWKGFVTQNVATYIIQNRLYVT